jgi:UDP-GlcNAc:undecaprenyl-phosphate GlcNAc-1-phosphate transferase
MLDALINFAVSAVICVLVIALLIPLSSRIRLLDTPDDRKQHNAPTPPVGGYGVFLGIVLPALIFYGLTRESIGFSIWY